MIFKVWRSTRSKVACASAVSSSSGLKTKSSSASVVFLPSTSPHTLQMADSWRISTILVCSVSQSPGRTKRRNLALRTMLMIGQTQRCSCSKTVTSMSLPESWARASMRITPGTTGKPGKWSTK